MPKFKDYLELCKPRVVVLMIVTSVVAMLLAVPAGQPLPWFTLIVGNIGIALTAFAGGVVNHMVDQRIDVKMKRTERRPIATGRVPASHAIVLAILLTVVGIGTLVIWVNVLCAVLSFFTVIGYAILYTLFLKHATPQNIVIGGLAGAMPPLLGWSAITGQINPGALVLVMIIFIWTPPHFWALAIDRRDDYAKASVPMLPVTHGVSFTKTALLLYTILLVAVTYLPVAIGMSGMIYTVGISLLNAVFLFRAIQLKLTDSNKIAMKTFWYSIWYLFAVFIVLLVDHYL